MRWPKWLHQMLAMLGRRAGVPQVLDRSAVAAEATADPPADDLDQIAQAAKRAVLDENVPTPRLCQDCLLTRSLCTCVTFAVLPRSRRREAEVGSDTHSTLRGGDSKRPSDKPPGRLPPRPVRRAIPMPPVLPSRRKDKP